jgi:hypothetical protein
MAYEKSKMELPEGFHDLGESESKRFGGIAASLQTSDATTNGKLLRKLLMRMELSLSLF